MLYEHMNTIEDTLIQLAKISKNAGHPLHIGTPRETFISSFLNDHLSENAAIGSGEIIDYRSIPKGKRNQFDIVIYRKNYPKILYGGKINCFFIESVISTIEVKSRLNKSGLDKAIRAAKNVKMLEPNNMQLRMTQKNKNSFGFRPPKITNYIVAYDGPKNMETVANWLDEIHKSCDVEKVRLSSSIDEILQTPSSTIDGVFILKKGFLYFDNVPTGFGSRMDRICRPEDNWIYVNTENGTLLQLFLTLTNLDNMK